MLFPQTFIDDLRRQADIVRVIQDYVPLKKKGSNWMACCPFHQEKTPSFSVNPSKDIFYCFGCGKGGNVFSFVMEMEHVAFPESIRIVAEKANVPLPERVDDRKVRARRNEVDRVTELNTWALGFWEKELAGASAGAIASLEYLTKRGISDETRRTFSLGYAPDSWDALSAHLKDRGASKDEIEMSGLVVRKDGGGSYDRFRNRLMFPVMDVQGRIVAFGSRTLGSDEPKYLNSPETPAYVKGRHLYGLNLTREQIRQKDFAILVEGYFDLIIGYQFGIGNMVASLGTALTTQQAKLLSRFAHKVVVNYDADSAGVKAAKRAIETLLAEDFEIKVLVLPEGADPDEFIRRNGEEAYHERRGKALPHIQFVLDEATRDRNLLRPADKAAAVEEALPFVRAVRNGIQQRDYFVMTMDSLRVEDPALREQLWKTVRSNEKSAQSRIVQRMAHDANTQPTIAEKQLLELLVHDEDLREKIVPRLETSDFEDLPTASIFHALVDLESNGGNFDPSQLMSHLGDDQTAVGFLSFLLISEPPKNYAEGSEERLASAEGCLLALRSMAIDRRISLLGHEMAIAERADDTSRRDQLALEHLEWTRRKRALGL